MKFSDRIGKTRPRETFQTDSMDARLSVKIWNLIYLLCYEQDLDKYLPDMDIHKKRFFEKMYMYFYCMRKDKTPTTMVDIYYDAMNRFEKSAWFEKYNTLEFYVDNYDFDGDDFKSKVSKKTIHIALNKIFKSELAGYQFVKGVLSPVMSEQEVTTVEEVFEVTKRYKNIQHHLQRSLELL